MWLIVGQEIVSVFSLIESGKWYLSVTCHRCGHLHSPCTYKYHPQDCIWQSYPSFQWGYIHMAYLTKGTWIKWQNINVSRFFFALPSSFQEENLLNSSTRWELCNSLIHFAVCYFHYQEGIKLHNSSSWITCIPLVQSQSSCFHTDHTCPQRLLAYTDSDHQHHTEDSQNLQFNHKLKLLYCM